jgi:hypothetical protein
MGAREVQEMSKPRTHWWVVVDKNGFSWSISCFRAIALQEKRDLEARLPNDRPFRVIKVQEEKK